MAVSVSGPLQAIEGKRTSAKCFSDWKNTFAARSVPWTNSCLWSESVGIAGTFYNTFRKGKPVFWIAFADSPVGFRQRFIVEVNPPCSGIDRRFQGVFAEDQKGRRYVLHRGALHPAKQRIAPKDFFKTTTVQLHDVEFSDGSIDRCAMVAPLDYGPDLGIEGLAQFVRDCSNARDKLDTGDEDSELERRVFGLEDGMPELRGNFSISGRDSSMGKRRHGEVWNELKSELARLKLRPSNARVGRYGPDIYTRAGKPLALFEIKVVGDSGSLQQALGQLLIYQELLGDDRTKVLVVPREPPVAIQRALHRHGVEWLTYGDPDQPKFDRRDLARMFDV